MMAMGSSIDEAFGMNINKKRNKKRDKLNVVNPSRLDPNIRNDIHGFDTNFQKSSNMIHANDDNDFHLLDQQDDYLGPYHPYNIQFIKISFLMFFTKNYCALLKIIALVVWIGDL